MKSSVTLHKRYEPVSNDLRYLIIKKVIRDDLSYRDTKELTGVSIGGITKIISAFKSGKTHNAKQRGRKIDENALLTSRMLAEIAKMSRFRPRELTRIWLAKPPQVVAIETARLDSAITQAWRILKREDLLKHCKNKKQSGVVAVHMVKIEWEDIDRPKVYVKGLLFMAMDLGTGRMNQRVYKRVTLWRVLDLIDTLMDKRENECRKITFTTRSEKQKSGNIRQVACIYKLSHDRFITALKDRLFEEYQNRIEILADPPTKRPSKRIRINGKYKNDNACKKINITVKEQVEKYNNLLLE